MAHHVPGTKVFGAALFPVLSVEGELFYLIDTGGVQRHETHDLNHQKKKTELYCPPPLGRYTKPVLRRPRTYFYYTHFWGTYTSYARKALTNPRPKTKTWDRGPGPQSSAHVLSVWWWRRMGEEGGGGLLVFQYSLPYFVGDGDVRMSSSFGGFVFELWVEFQWRIKERRFALPPNPTLLFSHLYYSFPPPLISKTIVSYHSYLFDFQRFLSPSSLSVFFWTWKTVQYITKTTTETK